MDGGCQTGCGFPCAGKVGGIHANSTYPADFIADNLAIALNVIRAAYEAGGAEAFVLGLVLYFSEISTAADNRRDAADGSARAHESMVAAVSFAA
jgi:hypothetical protein